MGVNTGEFNKEDFMAAWAAVLDEIYDEVKPVVSHVAGKHPDSAWKIFVDGRYGVFVHNDGHVEIRNLGVVSDGN